MEYSKEDLMEAKKQIWGVGENMGTEESKKIWEENAQFWDNAMGDESNEFHREVVRPKVTELLSPNPADYILDIACGNGNYSSYLAQRGASVVAFDYSKKMIELAKRRQSQYAKQIEFCVADATDRKSILGQFTRNYTQTVKRAADNKRRYAPGWVHSTCLLRGFPKGAAPHLAHDFAEQSVVCYTLCRRCPENTVAAGEGKGI